MEDVIEAFVDKYKRAVTYLGSGVNRTGEEDRRAMEVLKSLKEELEIHIMGLIVTSPVPFFDEEGEEEIDERPFSI